VLVACFLPAAASAHGYFPQARQVIFAPGSSEPEMVVTNFGLLFPESDGSWSWVCAPSFEGRTGRSPSAVRTDGGALLMALDVGAVRGTVNGCEWERASELSGMFMIDMQPDFADASAAYVLASEAVLPNFVARWTDSEGRFVRVSSDLEPGFITETLRIAPSDLNRWYLTGTIGSPSRVVLTRSLDAGMNWESFDVALEEGELLLLLTEIDPMDPERLWGRVLGTDHDRFVVSTDGGQGWQTIASLPADDTPPSYGRPAAMARGPDGVLWFGNYESGLWRAPDGAAVEQVDMDMTVYTLQFEGNEVWVGANGYTDGFFLGRSADGDPRQAVEVIAINEIRSIRSCPGDSPVSMICPDYWDDLLRDLQISQPEPPVGEAMDGGDDSVDAGVGAPPEGCGCRLSERPVPGTHGMLFSLSIAVLGAGRLRRRRRGSASTASRSSG